MRSILDKRLSFFVENYKYSYNDILLSREIPGSILLRNRPKNNLLDIPKPIHDFIPLPEHLKRACLKRKREFILGRLCAYEALKQLDSILIVPGISRDGSTEWPSHIVGSITHSKKEVAVLIAFKRDWLGLGIDIESLFTLKQALRVAKRVLTIKELKSLSLIPIKQIPLLVSLTFSIKESLFKALFPIIKKRFYFKNSEIISWYLDGRVRLRLTNNLSSIWTRGKEIQGFFYPYENRILTAIKIVNLQ